MRKFLPSIVMLFILSTVERGYAAQAKYLAESFATERSSGAHHSPYELFNECSEIHCALMIAKLAFVRKAFGMDTAVIKKDFDDVWYEKIENFCTGNFGNLKLNDDLISLFKDVKEQLSFLKPIKNQEYKNGNYDDKNEKYNAEEKEKALKVSKAIDNVILKSPLNFLQFQEWFHLLMINDVKRILTKKDMTQGNASYVKYIQASQGFMPTSFTAWKNQSDKKFSEILDVINYFSKAKNTKSDEKERASKEKKCQQLISDLNSFTQAYLKKQWEKNEAQNMKSHKQKLQNPAE